jgi:hypothetical protein
LQTKSFLSKNFSLFLCNTNTKPFTTPCSNIMSCILLSVGP